MSYTSGPLQGTNAPARWVPAISSVLPQVTVVRGGRPEYWTSSGHHCTGGPLRGGSPAPDTTRYHKGCPRPPGGFYGAGGLPANLRGETYWAASSYQLLTTFFFPPHIPTDIWAGTCAPQGVPTYYLIFRKTILYAEKNKSTHDHQTHLPLSPNSRNLARASIIPHRSATYINSLLNTNISPIYNSYIIIFQILSYIYLYYLYFTH